MLLRHPKLVARIQSPGYVVGGLAVDRGTRRFAQRAVVGRVADDVIGHGVATADPHQVDHAPVVPRQHHDDRRVLVAGVGLDLRAAAPEHDAALAVTVDDFAERVVGLTRRDLKGLVELVLVALLDRMNDHDKRVRALDDLRVGVPFRADCRCRHQSIRGRRGRDFGRLRRAGQHDRCRAGRLRDRRGSTGGAGRSGECRDAEPDADDCQAGEQSFSGQFHGATSFTGLSPYGRSTECDNRENPIVGIMLATPEQVVNKRSARPATGKDGRAQSSRATASFQKLQSWPKTPGQSSAWCGMPLADRTASNRR